MAYKEWLEKAVNYRDELQAMSSADIEDAFYKDLSFGTGGLRGVIGAGTNRMNIYTVARASQGLADYLNKKYTSAAVALSRDSRLQSDVFAHTAAGVFAANNIKVFFFKEIMPTPCLSFAVRRLGCSAGVMITASHNPAAYNGYKVYGADGCQITLEAAEDISAQINRLGYFQGLKHIGLEAAMHDGRAEYIGEDVLCDYINCVKNESFELNDTAINKKFPIVYSPLNGTGLIPVTRTLNESGFTDIALVEEQRLPDGNFTTCPYPNPEISETMALGIERARACGAELFFATDPDCDRIGVAVKADDGYKLLSGNETGLLLFDYICARRISLGKMPDNAVVIKTIVTSALIDRIAAHYGVGVINVLTGFKFIGEQIGRLERNGCGDSFIFGLEESCGYLSGTYVRDKDAVNGALLVCDMLAYYRSKNISLSAKLAGIYDEYGFCLDSLHSYGFDGADGEVEMRNIMIKLRGGAYPEGWRVERVCDYAAGISGLPAADVLEFALDNARVVVRPSGTEPKIKIYISVFAADKNTAAVAEQSLTAGWEQYLRLL